MNEHFLLIIKLLACKSLHVLSSSRSDSSSKLFLLSQYARILMGLIKMDHLWQIDLISYIIWQKQIEVFVMDEKFHSQSIIEEQSIPMDIVNGYLIREYLERRLLIKVKIENTLYSSIVNEQRNRMVMEEMKSALHSIIS